MRSEGRLVGGSDNGGAELADAVLYLGHTTLLRSLGGREGGITDMIVKDGVVQQCSK